MLNIVTARNNTVPHSLIFDCNVFVPLWLTISDKISQKFPYTQYTVFENNKQGNFVYFWLLFFGKGITFGGEQWHIHHLNDNKGNLQNGLSENAPFRPRLMIPRNNIRHNFRHIDNINKCCIAISNVSLLSQQYHKSILENWQ